jgi:hypothetical protein
MHKWIGWEKPKVQKQLEYLCVDGRKICIMSEKIEQEGLHWIGLIQDTDKEGAVLKAEMNRGLP